MPDTQTNRDDGTGASTSPASNEHAQLPSSQDSGPAPEAASSASFVRDHLPLFLSTVPILLVFLRVARVAGLDPSTLALMVQTVDVFHLTLATLIQFGPPLLLLALGLSIVTFSRGANTKSAEQLDVPPLPPAIPRIFVAILFLAIFATSPQFLLLIAVFVAANLGLDRLWAWHDRRRGKAPIFADYSAIFFGIFAVFLLTPNTMWLPAEKIDTKTNTSIVGYVLNDKDDQLTVMVEKTRKITTIKSSDVSKHGPCQLESGSLSKPLIAYGTGPSAQLPRCPK